MSVTRKFKAVVKLIKSYLPSTKPQPKVLEPKNLYDEELLVYSVLDLLLSSQSYHQQGHYQLSTYDWNRALLRLINQQPHVLEWLSNYRSLLPALLDTYKQTPWSWPDIPEAALIQYLGYQPNQAIYENVYDQAS